MGEHEEKLIEQMVRDGAPLPDHIQNAPTLTNGLQLYYNAFQDLSSCRAIGMSLGPIPWTALDQFCERYEIDGDQREDFFYHVSTLDEAYRGHLEKQAEKRRK